MPYTIYKHILQVYDVLYRHYASYIDYYKDIELLRYGEW